MKNLAKLDESVRKVCPIHGLSEDGHIDFNNATDEQKEAARAVVAAYDWDAPETKPPTIETRLAALEAKVFAKG